MSVGHIMSGSKKYRDIQHVKHLFENHTHFMLTKYTIEYTSLIGFNDTKVFKKKKGKVYKSNVVAELLL